MDKLDELKQIVEGVDLDDLANSQVGDVYEIDDVIFKVATVKPVKVSHQKYAVELSTEEGYTFHFSPVTVEDEYFPTFTHEDFYERPKTRKVRNLERDAEIYEKSKTIKSHQLAEEYGMTYQAIRYIIRKMEKINS